MGFGEAIRTCISKYVTFSGRASRSEFWFWTLFAVLVIAAGVAIYADTHTLVVSHIITLVMFLPSTAVFVRRMHDIDRTGWWVLVSWVSSLGFMLRPSMLTAIPIALFWVVWWVWLVIATFLVLWTCTRGTLGPNRYGLDPLAGVVGATVA